jgi:predicted phage tail protein
MRVDMKDIRGSGGKSSDASSRTPVESPDSLRSIAYARVTDLISEGEIEGLVNGLQSIYLDGVALQNPNGTFNFKDILVNTVNGTQDQDYIQGSQGSEAETAVGVEVKVGAGNAAVRSITDQQTSAVRVRIGVPALSEQNSTNGDLTGATAEITIHVQNNGGGYVLQDLLGKGIFTGKCTSMYERDFRINLPSPGPWDIKVSRLTADSASAKLNNKTYWQSYTTIIDAKLNFPNSALVNLQMPSDQFNAIPTRSFRIRGIKCKIPANYNPYTRKYATTGPGTTNGGWDGTFQVAWTSNPAWCFYDLLTKKRYGLGNQISAANIDKWSLYDIGQYNDVFVPSGVPKHHTLAVTTLMSAVAATNSIVRTSGSFGGTISVSLTGVKTNLTEQTYYKYGTDWYKLGFRVGDVVTVTGYTDAGNNGNKTITKIGIDFIAVGSGITSTETIAKSCGFTSAVAGDGFLPGDELTLSGWSNNSGRAVIKSVSGGTIVLTDEIALVDEASGSHTLTVVDFTEPRFCCNLYLQTAADAYKVIGNFASMFQSIAYWANGTIMLAQDAPHQPEYLFNSSNVEGGIFNYSGTARKARHTVAIVTWNDPSDHYKIKYKYVPNHDGLAKYGYRPVQVAGFGCTSEGLAIRIGKWVTRTELKDTQVVTFKTGLEGAARSPGAIISVLDPYKAGKRVAGRVMSATTTSVTVDGDPLLIEAGKTYTMSCVLPDGSVEEKAISMVPGSYTILTTAAFTVAPNRMTVWVMSATDLNPKLYRVLTVNEVEKTKFEIIALEHDPNKFAEVETGLIIPPKPTSVIASLTPPQGLTLNEVLYFGPGGTIKSRFNASWSIKPGVSNYKVRWCKDSGNWIEVDTQTAHFEILDADPGSYQLSVAGVIAGNITGAAFATLSVQGKLAPPANVTGLTAVLKNFTIEMKWNRVTDIDLDKYEIRQGASWAAGTLIARVDTTSFSIEFTAVGSYTFWVAAIDSSGNYSVAPTSCTLATNPTIPTSITMTKSTTP